MFKIYFLIKLRFLSKAFSAFFLCGVSEDRREPISVTIAPQHRVAILEFFVSEPMKGENKNCLIGGPSSWMICLWWGYWVILQRKGRKPPNHLDLSKKNLIIGLGALLHILYSLFLFSSFCCMFFILSKTLEGGGGCSYCPKQFTYGESLHCHSRYIFFPLEIFTSPIRSLGTINVYSVLVWHLGCFLYF